MWSIGCTLYELYTGNILFTGDSNNQMLKAIMEVRGKMSGKIYRRGELWAMHFDEMGNFISQERDKILGKVRPDSLSSTCLPLKSSSLLASSLSAPCTRLFHEATMLGGGPGFCVVPIWVALAPSQALRLWSPASATAAPCPKKPSLGSYFALRSSSQTVGVSPCEVSVDYPPGSRNVFRVCHSQWPMTGLQGVCEDDRSSGSSLQVNRVALSQSCPKLYGFQLMKQLWIDGVAVPMSPYVLFMSPNMRRNLLTIIYQNSDSCRSISLLTQCFHPADNG